MGVVSPVRNLRSAFGLAWRRRNMPTLTARHQPVLGATRDREGQRSFHGPNVRAQCADTTCISVARTPMMVHGTTARSGMRSRRKWTRRCARKISPTCPARNTTRSTVTCRVRTPTVSKVWTSSLQAPNMTSANRAYRPLRKRGRRGVVQDRKACLLQDGGIRKCDRIPCVYGRRLHGEGSARRGLPQDVHASRW
jgi:hypothetical protein